MQWSEILRASKERPLVACELSETSGVRARNNLCLRARRDLLRLPARRDFLCASEARAEPLWQRVAGIIRHCADIMPRIARNSGAIFHDIPDFQSRGGGHCAA